MNKDQAMTTDVRERLHEALEFLQADDRIEAVDSVISAFPALTQAPEPQADTAHHASGLDSVTGGTGVGRMSLPSPVATLPATAPYLAECDHMWVPESLSADVVRCPKCRLVKEGSGATYGTAMGRAVATLPAEIAEIERRHKLNEASIQKGCFNYATAWPTLHADRATLIAHVKALAGMVEGARAEAVVLMDSSALFLAATEALCDWMNGNDLSADHAEQKPQDYERLCSAMVKLREVLKSPTPVATAMLERMRGLEEALRPFAAAGKMMDSVHLNNATVVYTPFIDANYCITAGDLRRAAALTGNGAGKDGA